MITQIYEIQTPAEAEAMVALGVDHIGSVVTDGDAWKKPTIQETIRAVSRVGARSSLILLFDQADRISSALDYYRPDIVHFCQAVIGDALSWEAACGRLISLQATVKERFSQIAIMRSIPIPPPGCRMPISMMTLARYFEPLSDYFLTDTWLVDDGGQVCTPQPVDGYIGITGQTCDWQMAAELVEGSGIPVILAGGLSPENVRDGILAVRPAGVDSCTRTNARDEAGQSIRFRKDPDKVARFITEAKQAIEDIRQAGFE